MNIEEIVEKIGVEKLAIAAANENLPPTNSTKPDSNEEQVAETKETVIQPNITSKPISIGIDQREASTPSPSNRVFTGLASGQ